MYTESFNKKSKFFTVKHNLKMYFVTIVIFAHSAEKQPTFFFFFSIAIANDREITQEKRKPGPNPDDI